MLSSTQRQLSRQKTLHLLENLETSSSPISTLCSPPGLPLSEVEHILKTALDVQEIPPDLSTSVSKSTTGSVLFWGAEHKYLILAPFPITEKRAAPTCEVEPLRSLLQRGFIIALILIRLGAYGIGIFKGEAMLSSKVGTGLVHSRHRQGGSSAHRFERHREKQMESFFTRICAHAHEQLAPYARQLDFVIYGGTRETLLSFRKQCHYLDEFDSRTLESLLNVREPKQATLQAAIGEAWSSRVIQWHEEGKFD